MSTSEEGQFTAEFYATDLHAETLDLLQRVEDGQALNALRLLAFIHEQTRRVERALVRELRDEACSWAEIGEAFGMTRQGMMQRHEDVDGVR